MPFRDANARMRQKLRYALDWHPLSSNSTAKVSRESVCMSANNTGMLAQVLELFLVVRGRGFQLAVSTPEKIACALVRCGF